MIRDDHRRPCVEVLGLLDAGGPGLRRARRWRARWRRWGRTVRALLALFTGRRP